MVMDGRAAALTTKGVLVPLFKKFKFYELQNTIYEEFPEFHWKKVKSQLVKQHESFTTTNALKIFLKDLQKERIDVEDLRDRLLTLETVELSLHHNNKGVWHGYEFKGTCRRARTDPEEIEERIQFGFDQNHLEMAVRVVKKDNYIFVVMQNNPKKRKRQNLRSTYFVLLPKEKYFFAKSKYVLKLLLTILSDAMGYKETKLLKLMGKHIDSLVQLLHSKGTREGSIPQIQTHIPIERFYGYNFAQYHARKEYAGKFFNNNSPQFEFLKLGAAEQKWKHNVPPELTDEEVSISWEFQSSNVPKFLNNLIKTKVFATPIPEYIAHLLKFGKTELYLKNNKE